VITAGSNPHRRDDELRLELFHPPYLFKGPRPFIEAAPAQVDYGQLIEIHTPQATQIRWAQLIKPMATTHSVDTEQRLVDLPIAERSFCRLHVRIPPERTLAPPGWYMLSVVDHHGVPSAARWVHLTAAIPPPSPPPPGRHIEAKRLTVRTEGLRTRRRPEE